jgi:nicotinamidase-related amidase
MKPPLVMKPALVVIDVQQQPLSELVPGRRPEFLSTIASLLSGARERSVPVVYVRHQDEWMPPGSNDWQIAGEIAPREGESIVEKRYRDAFRETDLDDVLKRFGVERVIVCGMQTEFCVDATIREAERRGYRVDLVGDAHATAPAGGLSEEQIRTHMHRVAEGTVARIVSAADAFANSAS